jgi:hypothetical protein
LLLISRHNLQLYVHLQHRQHPPALAPRAPEMSNGGYIIATDDEDDLAL